MSVFAVSSAASRHLRRQLLSSAAGANPATSLRIGGGLNAHVLATARSSRGFSSINGGAKGGGLRRTQTKGRARPAAMAKSQPPSQSAASSSTGGSTPSPQSGPRQGGYKGNDPHSIANEMVNASVSSEGRAPGTESVATLTREQRMSNFAMAAGLLGFVSYIFYYSLASVGGTDSAKALIFGQDEIERSDGGGDEVAVAANNPGFDEFLKEANEGRSLEEERVRAETEAKGDARELAELDVAGSSSSEEEERDMARVAGFVEGDAVVAKKRPLWKRIVLFWRRE